MNFKPNMLFLNRSFDKKRLKALLLWFRLNLSENAALKAVEILQGLGFRSATQGAISLGLDDLKTPTSKGGRVFQAQVEVALAHHEHHRGNRTPVELFQHLVDTWHRTSQDLTTEVVQLFHSTERVNPVYMMAFSGARGNISQVRQLVGMRGLMADPRGQIVGFPILSNFREGLTITEYFVSCYGARKGVVDTAIRTADAGYLTRRLADVSHHVVVRTTNCGTHESILLRDIKEGQKTILSLANRLVGRVLAEHVFLPANPASNFYSSQPQKNGEAISYASPVLKNICTKQRQEESPLLYKPSLQGKNDAVAKHSQQDKTKTVIYRNSEITSPLASKLAAHYLEVPVRSPLSCSLPWGVCQLCYGWGLSEGRRVTLGEAVGIIAAQSIGEPGTQLTLRTFHTGGVFSGELLNEIRAPYNGNIIFPTPLQGLLLRTPHGQIAFLTKVSGKMKISETEMQFESKQAYQKDDFLAEEISKNVTTVNNSHDLLQYSALQAQKDLHTEDKALLCKEIVNNPIMQSKEGMTTKESLNQRGEDLLLQQQKDILSKAKGYKEQIGKINDTPIRKALKSELDLSKLSKQDSEFLIQPSTVIFVKQKEHVVNNQLLAEFSSSTLQSVNDQIEITQQVLSDTAGQIWFKELEYGNRKGPGSGSLGTYFSSQKLGGIWVLAGKPMIDTHPSFVSPLHKSATQDKSKKNGFAIERYTPKDFLAEEMYKYPSLGTKQSVPQRIFTPQLRKPLLCSARKASEAESIKYWQSKEEALTYFPSVTDSVRISLCSARDAANGNEVSDLTNQTSHVKKVSFNNEYKTKPLFSFVAKESENEKLIPCKNKAKGYISQWRSRFKSLKSFIPLVTIVRGKQKLQIENNISSNIITEIIKSHSKKNNSCASRRTNSCDSLYLSLAKQKQGEALRSKEGLSEVIKQSKSKAKLSKELAEEIINRNTLTNTNTNIFLHENKISFSNNCDRFLVFNNFVLSNLSKSPKINESLLKKKNLFKYHIYGIQNKLKRSINTRYTKTCTTSLINLQNNYGLMAFSYLKPSNVFKYDYLVGYSQTASSKKHTPSIYFSCETTFQHNSSVKQSLLFKYRKSNNLILHAKQQKDLGNRAIDKSINPQIATDSSIIAIDLPFLNFVLNKRNKRKSFVEVNRNRPVKAFRVITLPQYSARQAQKRLLSYASNCHINTPYSFAIGRYIPKDFLAEEIYKYPSCGAKQSVCALGAKQSTQGRGKRNKIKKSILVFQELHSSESKFTLMQGVAKQSFATRKSSKKLDMLPLLSESDLVTFLTNYDHNHTQCKPNAVQMLFNSSLKETLDCYKNRRFVFTPKESGAEELEATTPQRISSTSLKKLDEHNDNSPSLSAKQGISQRTCEAEHPQSKKGIAQLRRNAVKPFWSTKGKNKKPINDEVIKNNFVLKNSVISLPPIPVLPPLAPYFNKTSFSFSTSLSLFNLSSNCNTSSFLTGYYFTSVLTPVRALLYKQRTPAWIRGLLAHALPIFYMQSKKRLAQLRDQKLLKQKRTKRVSTIGPLNKYNSLGKQGLSYLLTQKSKDKACFRSFRSINNKSINYVNKSYLSTILINKETNGFLNIPSEAKEYVPIVNNQISNRFDKFPLQENPLLTPSEYKNPLRITPVNCFVSQGNKSSYFVTEKRRLQSTWIQKKRAYLTYLNQVCSVQQFTKNTKGYTAEAFTNFISRTNLQLSTTHFKNFTSESLTSKMYKPLCEAELHTTGVDNTITRVENNSCCTNVGVLNSINGVNQSCDSLYLPLRVATPSEYAKQKQGEALRSKEGMVLPLRGMKEPLAVINDKVSKTTEINEAKLRTRHLFPGQLITYGDNITSNIVTTESGQVLYIDSQKTTVRKAQTVLIYSQAIIAVLSGDWIKKGTPLMSLSYQKLVTGDIVQGLPKIEQFFEAPVLRDGTFWIDSLQAKLNQFFQEEREKLPLAEAVRKSFSEIQRVLVEGVLRVYISQGVLIADKHLEVIVRQMTCKGRILYSGDTGFLRNELVSLDKIENVNQVTYGQKALYHPQVRGITDASLESESFLSAASFQETTRVLSRDAIIGKTDLMRGLKERVIVGELIQAGTGLANNSVYNLLAHSVT